jgi:apolipoprotein N-acyltransferase
MIISKRWYPWLAFFVGLTMVLGFAPFNLYPITFVALAVLFYLLLDEESTLKEHALTIWAFSFGMLLTGVHWIFYSIHFFNGAHWILASLITLAFVFFISLLIFPFILITRYFRRQSTSVLLLLVFPAAWVATEGFRGWVFTGFPWLLIGQAQIDNWLAYVSPLTGVFGISWLTALLAGCLVLLFIGQKKEKQLAGILAISVLTLSFLLSLISWTTPTGDPIKVSMLQGNIAQENKWKPEYYQPSIELYQSLTEKSWDSDLIIWPETAIPGYFSNASENIIEPLRVQALMEQTALMIGGFYYERETDTTYNSILSINSDGIVDIYSKQHLVPFSEYFPGLSYLRWMEKWIQLPYDSVGRGTGKTTLDILGLSARVNICYEDVYGNEMINGLPDAQLLVNLSNDGWFTGSIEPAQHMQIARMRALETGRYLLRSTNNGVSGIIDEKGKVIATIEQYTQGIIKGEAKAFKGSTPYVHWGNGIIFMLTGFLLLIATFIPKTSSETNK